MKRTVGIVEDEVIIASDLANMVGHLGYEVIFIANTMEEARGALEKETPDVVLLDIRLKGHDDGILLGMYLRASFDTIIIFVTANSDSDTIRRAGKVRPDGYLVKPFGKNDVYAAIEIALSRHSDEESDSFAMFRDALFVRDRNLLLKVKFDDILYIEADGNHAVLHTNTRKLVASRTLKEVLRNLPSDQFIRIHKSFVVQAKVITAVGADVVYIDKTQLPLGRSYLQDVQLKIRMIG